MLSTNPANIIMYYLPEMTESPDLCGAFCVWLTKQSRDWLSGRYLCATWDVEELEAKRNDIVERDLLRISLRL